jgi:NADH-quinone oxidoreductase subunit M
MCVIAAFGIVITAAYVLRVLQICFWGPLKNPHYEGIPDAGPVEIACMSILAFVLIAVGMLPGWSVSVINSGVAPVLARVSGGG